MTRLGRGAWFVVAVAALNLGAASIVGPAERDEAVADEASAAEAVPPPPASLVDPVVVDIDGDSWAVAASLGGASLQTFEQRPDGAWEQASESLVNSPTWASGGLLGPSVAEFDGTWWLFFAAPSTENGRYCVGAASADDPMFGFEPEAEPLRCTDDADALDPTPYRDGDSLVLTWSERTVTETDESTTDSGVTDESIPDETVVDDVDDGDDDDTAADPLVTWSVVGAAFDPESVTLDDTTTLLSLNSGDHHEGWEAGVIDAPALIQVDGQLVLLYGGNEWGTASYAPGYATCSAPLGPCERRTVDDPLDVRIDGEQFQDLVGVGGLQPVLSDDDRSSVAFHGLTTSGTLGQLEATAFTAELEWRGGALHVLDPTQMEVTDE